MDSNAVTTESDVHTSRRGVLQTVGGAGALSVAGVAAAGGGSGDGPTAAFTADPSSPISGETEVTLDAASSTGDIETYEWYKTDLVPTPNADNSTQNREQIATGEVVSVTVAPPVEITLRVTDTNGNTNETSETFTLPPRICGPTGPLDIDGDGLYEAVRGGQQVTILDVQAFFRNLDSECVQNNPEAFCFSGTNCDEVTILDVQALFDRLG